jgi:hypothetical protein
MLDKTRKLLKKKKINNNKSDSIQKTKKRTLKLPIQKGGDYAEMMGTAITRLGFFDFKKQSEDVYRKCTTAFDTEYAKAKEKYDKKMGLSVSGNMYPDLTYLDTCAKTTFDKYQKSTQEFLEPFKDPEEVTLQNSYICYSDCHGATEGYAIVPPDTIVCFISGLGSLVSVMPINVGGIPIRNDDFISYVFHHLTPDKYKFIWENRENLKKYLKNSRDMDGYVNCFSESMWYYPGQLMPDVDLSISIDDIRDDKPYEFKFCYFDYESEDKPIKETPVGDGQEFVSVDTRNTKITREESFSKKFSEFMYYERPDTVKKYKLMIALACRGITYNTNETSKYYETELLTYHMNQDIIEKKYVKPFSQTLNPTCNFSSYKYYYLQGSHINFLQNPENRNPNYSPTVPLLMEIYEKLLNKPLNTDIYLEDVNYLSSLSINKLLFFMTKIINKEQINLDLFKKLVKDLLNNNVLKNIRSLTQSIHLTTKWNTKFLDTDNEFNSLYNNAWGFIQMINDFTDVPDMDIKYQMVKQELNSMSLSFLIYLNNLHMNETLGANNFRTYYFSKGTNVYHGDSEKQDLIEEIIISYPILYLERDLEGFTSLNTLTFTTEERQIITLILPVDISKLDKITSININNFSIKETYGQIHTTNINLLCASFRNLKVLKLNKLSFLELGSPTQYHNLETLFIDKVDLRNNDLTFQMNRLKNLEIYRIDCQKLNLILPAAENIILNDIPNLRDLTLKCKPNAKLSVNITTESKDLHIKSDTQIDLVVQDSLNPETFPLNINPSKIRNWTFQKCKISYSMFSQVLNFINTSRITGNITFYCENWLIGEKSKVFEPLFQQFVKSKKIKIVGSLYQE